VAYEVNRMDPQITIRAGKPDAGDGLAFACYLNIAAEGFFEFWLGKDFAATVADAYISPGHDLSYEHAAFALRDGEIVGMASCYSAEQHRRASDRPLRDATGYRPLRAAVIAAILRPVFRVLDRMEDGDFYLQAIAVDTECRGLGVGSILFAHAESRAIASGSARLCLDVSNGNDGAIHLYQRRGMGVIERSPRLFFAPRFRLLRMAKELQTEGQRHSVGRDAANSSTAYGRGDP
jgi:ribosomal protein S18 acetylase RimI-like enzyme